MKGTDLLLILLLLLLIYRQQRFLCNIPETQCNGSRFQSTFKNTINEFDGNRVGLRHFLKRSTEIKSKQE